MYTVMTGIIMALQNIGDFVAVPTTWKS